MTEDPVKLYVVVMAILLCVLGFVAWTSYKEASAYEAALERAPGEAKALKELASDVSALCKQLSKSKLQRGYKTLILDAATMNRLKHSLSGSMKDESVGRGRRGKKKRFNYAFGGTKKSPPATRDQIARFCRQVENDSQNILKTLEIKLSRYTGAGEPAAGQEDKVMDDRYKGVIIFGFQIIE
ncbi:MAG: hypothetical protein ACYTG3_05390 [Planctomycetota bacterium]|jgi:hypothetical protein